MSALHSVPRLFGRRRQEDRIALKSDLLDPASIPDAHFGGVWCTASLLHLREREAPTALHEMRRVLLPGGMLFLGVQEGTGEGWESAPYDVPVNRFFARYGMDEAEDMVSRAGCVILTNHRTDVGSCRWLQNLARKAGEGGE